MGTSEILVQTYGTNADTLGSETLITVSFHRMKVEKRNFW